MAANAIMVDIESLSTRKNAAILSIGALRFDPHSDITKLLAGEPKSVADIQAVTQSFYCRVQFETCKDLKLHIDADTVRWWMKQTREAQYEVFLAPNRLPILDAMNQFYLWAGGCDTIWSKGESFDICILSEIYAIMGKRTPWKFFNERCVRTAYDMGGVDDRLIPKAQAHHALFDCWYQTIGVQLAYRNLEPCRLVNPTATRTA